MVGLARYPLATDFFLISAFVTNFQLNLFQVWHEVKNKTNLCATGGGDGQGDDAHSSVTLWSLWARELSPHESAPVAFWGSFEVFWV